MIWCSKGKRVGGFIEVKSDGSESDWGRVTEWDPFGRVRFQWHPGREPETAQEVSVTFTELKSGTLVKLVQTGWENLEEQAEFSRAGYDKGWDFVLAQYTAATKGA